MFNNAQITAVTQQATISTANSNRDGTGTIETVLTVDSLGYLIQTVVVKAVNVTENGIVRLFLKPDGSEDYFLFEEFLVNVTEPSGEFESYSSTLILPGQGYYLAPGWTLGASTQYAQEFNVFASGFKWSY